MPRANRYWVNGAAYHLTHRCHDRAFLLRAREERDAYRALLRRYLIETSSVSLLNYTITSNHVHLLVTSESAEDVATLMRRVQGEHAANYNRRTGRSGAFWSDRYHATMIESGDHLLACMKYIDLNMVRAGVVKHPGEWDWTGWHELVGEKARYRIIDSEALLRRLASFSITMFREYYRRAIDEMLTHSENMTRDKSWTESVAVGSLDFIQRMESALVTMGKRNPVYRDKTSCGAWSLKEERPSFGLQPGKAPPSRAVRA